MKVCSQCNIEKSISEFFKRKASKDGYQPICKVCDLVQRKFRKDANPEKERAYKKAYALEHAEKMRAYAKAYHLQHREEQNRKSNEAYAANREAIAAALKIDRQANPEKYRRQTKNARLRNGDKIRARRRAEYRRNKARYIANARKRELDTSQATPSWADLKAIEAVYQERERISEQTQIVHHVDHIIPIHGKNVCGLHVDYNLQIIPALENLQKSNKI